MLKNICILFLLLLTLSGCGNREEKARMMFNKAQILAREGNIEEAKSLYFDIISNYKTTEISTRVYAELDKIALSEPYRQERRDRQELCIKQLRLLTDTVGIYRKTYNAPMGTTPGKKIIMGESDSYIKNVLKCPEGDVPYDIPKVGSYAVCPNEKKFPGHKL